MHTWMSFVGMAKETAGLLALSWPVTLPLLMLIAGAAIWSRSQLNAFFRVGTLWQLLPVAVLPAMAVLGAVFACENCNVENVAMGHRHPWALRATELLFCAQLLAVPILVRVAVPLRLLVASLQLFLLWCSFWATFAAELRIWPTDLF